MVRTAFELAGVRQFLETDMIQGDRDAACPRLSQHGGRLVGADDAVPGRGHHREVPACPAGRIQDLGGRWAGAQQPPHPIFLRLGGVAVVVICGRLLVVAGEDGCAPLVEPGLPVHGASLGSDVAPSGAELVPEPEDAIFWRMNVSSRSGPAPGRTGFPGASWSPRRRGQVLSGCVPDTGSCWLSRAGIATGSTITAGQRVHHTRRPTQDPHKSVGRLYAWRQQPLSADQGGAER